VSKSSLVDHGGVGKKWHSGLMNISELAMVANHPLSDRKFQQ